MNLFKRDYNQDQISTTDNFVFSAAQWNNVLQKFEIKLDKLESNFDKCDYPAETVQHGKKKEQAYLFDMLHLCILQANQCWALWDDASNSMTYSEDWQPGYQRKVRAYCYVYEFEHVANSLGNVFVLTFSGQAAKYFYTKTLPYFEREVIGTVQRLSRVATGNQSLEIPRHGFWCQVVAGEPEQAHPDHPTMYTPPVPAWSKELTNSTIENHDGLSALAVSDELMSHIETFGFDDSVAWLEHEQARTSGESTDGPNNAPPMPQTMAIDPNGDGWSPHAVSVEQPETEEVF